MIASKIMISPGRVTTLLLLISQFVHCSTKDERNVRMDDNDDDDDGVADSAGQNEVVFVAIIASILICGCGCLSSNFCGEPPNENGL